MACWQKPGRLPRRVCSLHQRPQPLAVRLRKGVEPPHYAQASREFIAVHTIALDAIFPNN